MHRPTATIAIIPRAWREAFKTLRKANSRIVPFRRFEDAISRAHHEAFSAATVPTFLWISERAAKSALGGPEQRLQSPPFRELGGKLAKDYPG